ncbi:19055_t:CDS:1, partial [Funneliformis geosporum]
LKTKICGNCLAALTSTATRIAELMEAYTKESELTSNRKSYIIG